MEVNEKYKSYQQKLKEFEGNNKSGDFLRYFHLKTENIYDNIKSSKSPRDFKWLFILLCSLLIIAVAIHIGIRGIGLNLLPLILLLIYWVYYRYQLKIAIADQAIKNKKISENSSDDLENKQKLSNRIKFIINGIEVLNVRVKLIRNQYVIFFPILAILFIDLIKGPLNPSAIIITAIISIILGGLFWIYYFKNDLLELQDAEDELEELDEDLDHV